MRGELKWSTKSFIFTHTHYIYIYIIGLWRYFHSFWQHPPLMCNTKKEKRKKVFLFFYVFQFKLSKQTTFMFGRSENISEQIEIKFQSKLNISSWETSLLSISHSNSLSCTGSIPWAPGSFLKNLVMDEENSKYIYLFLNGKQTNKQKTYHLP